MPQPALDHELYDTLRRIARRVHGHRAPATMTPTLLVHEAWEKLARGKVHAHDRTHFVALLARAMRQILIDQARAEASAKRGAHRQRTTLSGLASDPLPVDLLAVDEAVRALEAVDPKAADIVVLRSFGGLTVTEAAQEIGCSERTAYVKWAFGRAFVLDELG